MSCKDVRRKQNERSTPFFRPIDVRPSAGAKKGDSFFSFATGEKRGKKKNKEGHKSQRLKDAVPILTDGHSEGYFPYVRLACLAPFFEVELVFFVVVLISFVFPFKPFS